jgi:hypothetical protein
VLFPAWNNEEWKVTERTDYPADSEHSWAFSLLTLQRQ